MSATITITQLATGPTPPKAATPDGPNALRTRVAELAARLGPPPWSRRVIQDERQLVTLIANQPGGGNRPHGTRSSTSGGSSWPASSSGS